MYMNTTLKSGIMRAVIAFVLFVIPATLISDNIKEEMKKLPPLKQKKYAKQLLEAGNYFQAITAYEVLLDKNAKDAQLAYKMAEAYRGSRNYPKAAKWYKNAHEFKPGKEPASQYWQAMMLKMDGQYDAAIQVFDEFLESGQASSVKSYRTMPGWKKRPTASSKRS